MENKRIKAFVCDWEGCGSYPGGGRVPLPSLDLAGLVEIVNVMYKKWLKNKSNPQIVLCTGRQIPYSEAILQLLNAFWNESEAMPSVLENGACLYIPSSKEIIPNDRITGKNKEALKEIDKKIVSFAELIGGKKEAGKEYCISLNPPENTDALEKYALQHSIPLSYDHMKLFYAIISEELKDYGGLIKIAHSRSAVDITPRGVDKGTGLEMLRKYIKKKYEDGRRSSDIDFCEMVGVGDSQGDEPLLSRVGYPACPANADDNTRKIVEDNPNGYKSPFECTKGLIDIILHYLPGLQNQFSFLLTPSAHVRHYRKNSA